MIRHLTLLALLGCTGSTPTETGTADTAAPGLGDVTLDPQDPGTADVITAHYTPPEGAEVRWQWFVDNVLDETQTTAIVAPDATARGQVWRVVVTPLDGQTPIGEPHSAKVTIANTAPAVVSLTLTEAPTVVSGVEATTEIDDPDGDAVTLSYAWSIDGRVDVSYQGPTLPAGAAARDAQVQVTVTPSDGDLAGEPAQAGVTLGNTPPSLAGATLSSEDPTPPAGTVTVVPSGWYDADGDAEGYSYRWHVNGAPVFDVKITDTFPLLGHAPGEVIYCEVTPTDGIDEGEPVLSDSLIVQEGSP